MEVVAGVDRLERGLGRLMIAIGVFDGLHLGHRYLLRHLRHEAARRGARATVITFDHHPDEIILGSAPPLLCDPEERLALLARAGVEVVVVQHFDAAVRGTPYDVFVRRIADRVPLAGFVMTPDAAFGHDRLGTPTTVAALGRELGFDVVVIPPLDLVGHHVRSSEIRSALTAGDIPLARRLLGRPIEVHGTLDPDGATRRGTIRFEVPVVLPANGRFRAILQRNGARIPGAEGGTPASVEPPATGRPGLPAHRVTAVVDDGSLSVVAGSRTRLEPGRVRLRLLAPLP